MRYGKHLTLAFRSLRSGGRFTLAVLLLLALGIGPTTAMFSVVNGVLLRPLALPDPDQLMLIGERIPQMPQTAGLAWFDNLAAFSAWQREANDFTGMSLIISSRLPVMGGAAPARRQDLHPWRDRCGKRLESWRQLPPFLICKHWINLRRTPSPHSVTS